VRGGGRDVGEGHDAGDPRETGGTGETPPTRTFRVTVSYDGTDFFGWQVQPGRRTVQGLIEKAIEATTGERPRVTGAGRTDSGVHALGQVASFDLATRLAPATLERALNATLPRDVALRDLAEAPPGWNARYRAASRVYVYRIARRRSPLLRRTAWEMWAALDLDRVRAASEDLLGEHDMSAFAAAPPAGKSGVVRLLRAAWRDGEGLLLAEFEADRFLRGMVRRVVGTLVEVGRGRRAPEDVARIIGSRDRAQAGPSAPARGLCLVAVRYPEEASNPRDNPSEVPRDFPRLFD